MLDLSVIIPARNEMFLSRTIQDILANFASNYEIIAILDGSWAEPVIDDNTRVTLVYHPESIGQRAACNEAAKIARGKYLMKVDAHCSFEKDFDIKLLNIAKDYWTVAPAMRNLHAFDWVCDNGHRRYQSPSGPCKECGSKTNMDIRWISKPNPESYSYCFDATPHFQYFKQFSSRPEGKGSLVESMSLQGSCFMLTRDKWFELGICDEAFGSWGSQGIEVSLKTWLSGGRVIVYKDTWYAHLFRTQGGDFGFPYNMPAKQAAHAKELARQYVYGEKRFEGQIRDVEWLLKRFWPIPGWTESDLNNLKGVSN